MAVIRLKDYNTNDTIAAIATFPAAAALGVIKVSGPRAIAIVSKIFKPAGNKKLCHALTHTMHYGWIFATSASPKKNSKKAIIDEVIVSLMRRPRSYTRQDVVEISSHGGVAVMSAILDCLIRAGARLALPGEFTYRAICSGRIDIFQAEGVLAMVQAKTEVACAAAAQQLSAKSHGMMEEVHTVLKELVVATEAYLNFPEDGTHDVHCAMPGKLKALEKKISLLVTGAEQARALREGIRCVICGKTNVGKSALFNYLLQQERVIVSDVCGTTRDVIEEVIVVKGIPLRLYDTAGLLTPTDTLSHKAIEKTNQIFEQADLLLLVLDGSRSLDKHDHELIKKIRGRQAVIIINKIDLPGRLVLPAFVRRNAMIVMMSVGTHVGLAALERAIVKKVYRQGLLDRGNLIFLNHYQQQALLTIKQKIAEAQTLRAQGYTIDFINAALKECLDQFAKLTGETVTEEILESLFSRFCIGK